MDVPIKSATELRLKKLVEEHDAYDRSLRNAEVRFDVDLYKTLGLRTDAKRKTLWNRFHYKRMYCT
jgi:hypothetical protein